MEDLIRKAVIAAKKTAPNDWFEQRKIIGKVINEILNDSPQYVNSKSFPVGNKELILISFDYTGDYYFWWDVIVSGVIECSGLERALKDIGNGRVQTELLWNSDPTNHEPFIPRLSIFKS